MRKAGLAVLGCLLLASACRGTPALPRPVATLPISNGYPLHAVTLSPKVARVPAGSEFSVVADATDGPLAWRLTTAGRASVVQAKGSAPVGSCGSPLRVGCALPLRYTFLARAPGTTTMVWTEYTFVCPSHPAAGCPAEVQPIRVTVTR